MSEWLLRIRLADPQALSCSVSQGCWAECPGWLPLSAMLWSRWRTLKNFFLVPLVKRKRWITTPVLVHREVCQHRSEILRTPTLSARHRSRTFGWGDFSRHLLPHDRQGCLGWFGWHVQRLWQNLPQIYMSLADSLEVRLQVNYFELRTYFPITVIW